MKRIFAVVLLLAMIFCLAAPLLAVKDTTFALPTWPQKFSLAYGDHAALGIPVAHAGPVTVTVEWRGRILLDIALLDFTGKVVAEQLKQPAPSATLKYTVTEGDLRGGNLWTVRLTTPEGKNSYVDANTNAYKTIASGTVTATYPEVTLADLEPTQKIIVAQHEITMSALRKGPYAGLLTPEKVGVTLPSVPILPLPAEKGRAIRLATDQKSLENLMITTPIKKPILKADLSSRIHTITPSNAMPGDVVNLNVYNIDASYTDDTVIFTFNKNITRVVKPQIAVQLADTSVNLQVKVPSTADIGAITETTISVKAKDRTTPEMAYQVNDVPTPAITTVSPDPLPNGTTVNVAGNRIMKDATVHYIMPGGKDTLGSSTFVDEHSMKAIAPVFSTADTVQIQVYVANRDGKKSAPVTVTIPANQSAITGVDRFTAEPGEVVLITGKNFIKPTVYFYPYQTQDANTILFKNTNVPGWDIIASTDTQLLVRIPEAMGGFSGPLRGDLKIVALGNAVSVPFTVKPLIVVQPITNAKIAWQYVRDDTALDSSRVFNATGNNGQYWWVSAMHMARWYMGFANNDAFSAQVTLGNGWSIDHGEVKSSDSDSNAGAYVENCVISPLNGYPTICVRWWADPSSNTVIYQATIYIRGPQGVPYDVMNR
ncbi:MAG: hypothetical protein WCJ56_10040 [bacterium]